MLKIPFYGTYLAIRKYEHFLRKQQQTPALVTQSLQLATCINSQDWTNTYFNDPQSWIHAKLAVEANLISTEDYATAMLRSSLALDIECAPTDVKAMPLDHEVLMAHLKSIFNSIDMPLDQFIQFAKQQLPTNKLYCFVAQTAKQPVKFFKRIRKIENISPFAPIISNDGKTTTYIVPSFQLLSLYQQFFINIANEHSTDKAEHFWPVEIIVCEGTLIANDIVNLHRQMKHPMNISTPYAPHIEADDYHCGHYGFAWHDACFHLIRLIQRPGLNMEMYLVEKTLEYYDRLTSQPIDEPFTTNTEERVRCEGLQQLLIRLIDMEHPDSNEKEDLGGTFKDIVNGPMDSTQKMGFMEIYCLPVMEGLLTSLLASMVEDRALLNRSFGVDTARIIRKLIVKFKNNTLDHPTLNPKNGYLCVIESIGQLLRNSIILSEENKNWLRSQVDTLVNEIESGLRPPRDNEIFCSSTHVNLVSWLKDISIENKEQQSIKTGLKFMLLPARYLGLVTDTENHHSLQENSGRSI